MRLIPPSVTLIKESDPFKKIERVGRTCYKSEDKITEDSAKAFYKSLIKRNHTAMLEHATFVFEVNEWYYDTIITSGHKYLNCTKNLEEDRFLVSGNLRALNESKEPILLQELYSLDPDLVYVDFPSPSLFMEHITSNIVELDKLERLSVEEFNAHAYYSFHFICDRGVTHEIVRHRPASYAQESTRYCNYTRDKFGGEITFIKPAKWDELPDHIKFRYYRAWETSEDEYARLISYGQTPQQARAVLPNALKTEIIMTANAGEFEHFFDLRSRGTTGAPHPDMKVVADKALELYTVDMLYSYGLL